MDGFGSPPTRHFSSAGLPFLTKMSVGSSIKYGAVTANVPANRDCKS